MPLGPPSLAVVEDDDAIRWADVQCELPGAADPDVARVRALVESRLLGDPIAPATLGRFALLERIAAGGMGVVFAAYDRELDRKVALKVLHADRDRDASRHRIVREAQAMAKLSHPNVAHVYDVGVHEGRTFIAMELVAGQTLRAWQSERPRTTAEILAVYAQAGRGLAAAHAAGLVHRDFKPDNVLVGSDPTAPRVRVVDFGLARVTDVDTISADDDTSATTRVSIPGSSVAFAGSPAYMAPEQLAREDVDARADQFGFCVSLWEALVGQRPFGGANPQALLASIAVGVRESNERDVRPWLRAVLLRGLALDRAERYPSMDALLHALADDPSRRRRRTVAVASVLGLAGVLAGLYAIDREGRARACASEASAIADVWNDHTRTRVEAALLATGTSFAPTTWERVGARLDAFTGEWADVREQTCLATNVERTRTEADDARTRECLAERSDALAGLVDVLLEADRDVARDAVRAATSLPLVADCTDDARLARRPTTPIDPDSRERIAALRRALARTRSLAATGRYADADARARDVVDGAQALGWAPLHAEALVVLGTLEAKRGELDRAEDTLQTAVDLAVRESLDDAATDAMTKLVHTTGHLRAKHERGRWWGQMALGFVERTGERDRLRGANVLRELGLVAVDAGELAQARALHEQALAIEERWLGPDHPDVAATLTDLARAHHLSDDEESALPLFERALAIEERALGPDHPDLAPALNSLGEVMRTKGDHQAALAHYERALALLVGALGPAHAKVGTLHNNIAITHLALGDHERAEQGLLRALEVREAALGPSHPDVSATLTNLGAVHHTRGDYEKAATYFERALELKVQELGPDHLAVADGLNNYGAVLIETRRLAEAQTVLERALAIREAKLGSEHADVASSIEALANVHHALGHDDVAMPMYERALELRERTLAPDDPDIAGTLLNIASIHYMRAEHGEAKALNERAAQIWERALGPDHPGLAMCLGNLGNSQFALDDLAGARASFERSLAIRERAFGPDHPDIGIVLGNLAMVHRALGEWDEARRVGERAVDIIERRLGVEHTSLVHPLAGLVDVALAQERFDDAVLLGERAVAVGEGPESEPSDRARARYALARALVAAGREHARAIALAQRARAEYREIGETDMRVAVERWLARER